MNAEDFVMWLKGYLDALQSDKAEVKVISERLKGLTQKPKSEAQSAIVAHVPPYPLKTYHL